MSREQSDRTAQSRGPFGDATAVRDAVAPIAFAGIPAAIAARRRHGADEIATAIEEATA